MWRSRQHTRSRPPRVVVQTGYSWLAGSQNATPNVTEDFSASVKEAIYPIRALRDRCRPATAFSCAQRAGDRRKMPICSYPSGARGTLPERQLLEPLRHSTLPLPARRPARLPIIERSVLRECDLRHTPRKNSGTRLKSDRRLSKGVRRPNAHRLLTPIGRHLAPNLPGVSRSSSTKRICGHFHSEPRRDHMTSLAKSAKWSRTRSRS